MMWWSIPLVDWPSGKFVLAPKEVTSIELSEPLKPVLRKAQPDDLEQMKKNEGKRG